VALPRNKQIPLLAQVGILLPAAAWLA
jgi:hypothetical protein